MEAKENMTKTFTLEELKEYNGENGKSAYVAFKGKIYDMTNSPMWDDGDHFGLHAAGRDLTGELGDAPHGEEAFEGRPIVGELVDVIT